MNSFNNDIKIPFGAASLAEPLRLVAGQTVGPHYLNGLERRLAQVPNDVKIEGVTPSGKDGTYIVRLVHSALSKTFNIQGCASILDVIEELLSAGSAGFKTKLSEIVTRLYGV